MSRGELVRAVSELERDDRAARLAAGFRVARARREDAGAGCGVRERRARSRGAQRGPAGRLLQWRPADRRMGRSARRHARRGTRRRRRERRRHAGGDHADHSFGRDVREPHWPAVAGLAEARHARGLPHHERAARARSARRLAHRARGAERERNSRRVQRAGRLPGGLAARDRRRRGRLAARNGFQFGRRRIRDRGAGSSRQALRVQPAPAADRPDRDAVDHARPGAWTSAPAPRPRPLRVRS